MNRTYCHKLCIYQVGDIPHLSSNCILFPNKKDGNGQETIQLSITPGAEYHMASNINTIKITNKSQEVSSLPAGDHKAAMYRRDCLQSE